MWLSSVVNNGAIAQLVEQRTENPCVPGSIPGGTTKKLDFGRVFCLYSRLSADYLRPVGSQFSNNVGTNVGSKSERYKKCRHKSWHTQNGESNNQAAK